MIRLLRVKIHPRVEALGYWLMNGDAILSSGIIATITLDWQVEN